MKIDKNESSSFINLNELLFELVEIVVLEVVAVVFLTQNIQVVFNLLPLVVSKLPFHFLQGWVTGLLGNLPFEALNMNLLLHHVNSVQICIANWIENYSFFFILNPSVGQIVLLLLHQTLLLKLRCLLVTRLSIFLTYILWHIRTCCAFLFSIWDFCWFLSLSSSCFSLIACCFCSLRIDCWFSFTCRMYCWLLILISLILSLRMSSILA